MSISELMAEMAEAGAPMEAILIAVRAIEVEREKDAARRAKKAEQKRKERAKDSDSRNHVARQSHDSSATAAAVSQDEPTARADIYNYTRADGNPGRNPSDSSHLVKNTATQCKNSGLSAVSGSDEPDAQPAELFELSEFRRKPAPKRESAAELLDRVTDQWNAWAVRHGSPAVRNLTDKRAIHCRRRIADLKTLGYGEPEAAFASLLAKCSESFYARGSPRKPLEFDQLMREDFMTRMLEGAFEHREARKG